MKPSILYFCLTAAVIFFAVRVFAANTTGFYDQLTTLYSQSQKIQSIDKAQGIWLGECYPRYPVGNVSKDVIDVEAFVYHWVWNPPKGSPLQPIDAGKFQIRPKSHAPDADWQAFLSQAGQLGNFEEYVEEHISPNTWGPLFSQIEIARAQEADVKTDNRYLYVWLRAPNDFHWACYLSFDHHP